MQAREDSEEETFVSQKEHTFFKEFYQKIRQPQAFGKVPFVFVFALLLNPPFLVLFSFIWILTFFVASLAKGKELVICYGDEYIVYKKKTGFIIPKMSQKIICNSLV